MHWKIVFIINKTFLKSVLCKAFFKSIIIKRFQAFLKRLLVYGLNKDLCMQDRRPSRILSTTLFWRIELFQLFLYSIQNPLNNDDPVSKLKYVGCMRRVVRAVHPQYVLGVAGVKMKLFKYFPAVILLLLPICTSNSLAFNTFSYPWVFM